MTAPRQPAAPVPVDAFVGSMVGLAVGDALGFATEFRRRQAILDTFGPDGVTDFVGQLDPRWPARPAIIGRGHPPGTYSDDTQMSIAVAEALLDGPTDDVDTVMRRMARRFVDWSRSGDNDRAPGNACLTGCRNLARGVPWREAGVADSKGCGSAMRVAAIGLVCWRDRSRLLELARASSLPTHRHDAGIEGAAAAALLVALALEKSSPAEMYDAVLAECGPRSADFDRCWRRLPQMLDRAPASVLSEQGLGESWVAEEAVASALYCFWRAPTDFRATVLTAVNTDGDSDSIGCIAGSISGAYNGVAAIPEHWRQNVENSSLLHRLGERLHAAAVG
ncbi:MAG: ADP-ribosylglycohydrolase family protein [Deltaproteobacteria bacterium]|nr:ADP-ribosylglycohydrolase family protein [Deltaproteobacteria bacterium]